MRKIYAMALGAYQTNCYIFHDDAVSSCCLVDPGYEPELILQKLSELGLTLEAILLTHGHFDHVGAVRQIAVDTDCDVYICAEDLSLPAQITAGSLYHTKTYAEGDTLSLAGLSVTVLQTPGHTPGSVCLLVGDVMFSGDTLFAGSCGRTDLPGGDWKTIRSSLSRLASLDGNFWVLPGHGESTTLAEEKKYNPYMR